MKQITLRRSLKALVILCASSLFMVACAKNATRSQPPPVVAKPPVVDGKDQPGPNRPQGPGGMAPQPQTTDSPRVDGQNRRIRSSESGQGSGNSANNGRPAPQNPGVVQPRPAPRAEIIVNATFRESDGAEPVRSDDELDTLFVINAAIAKVNFTLPANSAGVANPGQGPGAPPPANPAAVPAQGSQVMEHLDLSNADHYTIVSPEPGGCELDDFDAGIVANDENGMIRLSGYDSLLKHSKERSHLCEEFFNAVNRQGISIYFEQVPSIFHPGVTYPTVLLTIAPFNLNLPPEGARK